MFKGIVRKVPGFSRFYRVFQDALNSLALRTKAPEEIFTDIYRNNKWGGDVSLSGRGSEGVQIRFIAEQLPIIFREFNIKSIIDVPCGDFHWMNSVDRHGVDYVGGDIVKELIEVNREQFASDHVRFQHIDLLRNPLPTADLVFCRDCLVHFSNSDVMTALKNICHSGSRLLLTTSFVSRKSNADIVTGQWRPLSLQAGPFYLPEPLRIITEGCSEGEGHYADKSLLLWKVSDIRSLIVR
jgi:hypothetical protein